VGGNAAECSDSHASYSTGCSMAGGAPVRRVAFGQWVGRDAGLGDRVRVLRRGRDHSRDCWGVERRPRMSASRRTPRSRCSSTPRATRSACCPAARTKEEFSTDKPMICALSPDICGEPRETVEEENSPEILLPDPLCCGGDRHTTVLRTPPGELIARRQGHIRRGNSSHRQGDIAGGVGVEGGSIDTSPCRSHRRAPAPHTCRSPSPLYA
jgi:hypothetical protein